ncbi:flavodoxin family protein [Candidatus Bathyarchaeota archaeon]|nr:flavodoxin family protein [Candidatus Bathyarchaeota archaeon]
MMIVGIVGSPRRDGLTNRLVNAALEGAKLGNAEVKKVYLADFDISARCPEDLNKLCEDADAIILGAPVYWGDINSLTKDFMDKVRISSSDGRYALGISIAGGSGKGLISGIQSIYHFFFHKGMKGIDPTPVSRFNLDEATKGLIASGRKLASLSSDKKPFRDMGELTKYYQSVPFVGSDILDEFMLLGTQLLKVSKSNRIEYAKKEYEKAKALTQSGDRAKAATHAVNVYEALYIERT